MLNKLNIGKPGSKVDINNVVYACQQVAIYSPSSNSSSLLSKSCLIIVRYLISPVYSSSVYSKVVSDILVISELFSKSK